MYMVIGKEINRYISREYSDRTNCMKSYTVSAVKRQCFIKSSFENLQHFFFVLKEAKSDCCNMELTHGF